ncbi:UDP-glycosyltransferase 87A2-like [Chenopodium quinoa]|uniref:Glycosyltransferase n=1 Tax=Chenopodium quinoa TaxID=63459 RepID=A0A803MPT9_CHEQI|nr:UDP-glycosyltransferase 87A2-like [Chenopodium quinoa]
MASLQTITSKNCHIVIVPYPGRGHINPMFTLCNQLVSSPSGTNLNISFTIVLTEEWVTLINPNDKPANACFATIPNVLPSEHIRGADNEGFLHAVYTKMEEHVERILDALEAPPNVIIADTFLPWVVGVGTRRNIPVASFWPLLACLFPALHHYDLFVSNNHYPLDSLMGERGDERVDYIPGIGSTRLADLPLALHSYKKRMLDLMLDAISYMPKAQFIILRTLEELERPAIDAMKTILPSTSIYPIGPAIILPKPENNQTSDHHCLDDQPDYIKWLNSQPEKSVLYVSLGSHLSPSMAQLEELALGLCDSRVPFLFVGREETSFLKDVCGDHKDGFIVPWCDQMKVLYHKSIGGFLNHAGLNSVLESAFAGVPMLTFPLSTDQPMYSKLAVEDWKIGMRLRDKIEKDILIKREKVKELVIKFMDFESEEVKEMNKNSKEFKQVVWAAIAKDSTAEHYVGEFLSEISTKNATN